MTRRAPSAPREGRMLLGDQLMPAPSPTAALRLPQAVEHHAGGKAVGDLAGGGLEVADGDAGARAEETVRLADVEAAPHQTLLQFVTLGDGEHALVARPGLHE